MVVLHYYAPGDHIRRRGGQPHDDTMCAGRTRLDQPCYALRVKGSKYCRHHQPA